MTLTPARWRGRSTSCWPAPPARAVGAGRSRVDDDVRAGLDRRRAAAGEAPAPRRRLHRSHERRHRVPLAAGRRPLRRRPEKIDHAVVGVARRRRPQQLGTALLLKGRGHRAGVDGRAAVHRGQQPRSSGIAAMSAATWGGGTTSTCYPTGALAVLRPGHGRGQRGLGFPEQVPPSPPRGGSGSSTGRRPVADGVGELWREVRPLADALAATPSCFLHGDWKNGNIGLGADGRVVPDRLGVPGRRPALPRARLVPGPQPGPDPEGATRRTSSPRRRPRGRGRRHRRLVGAPAHPRPLGASCSSAGRRPSATTTSSGGGATAAGGPRCAVTGSPGGPATVSSAYSATGAASGSRRPGRIYDRLADEGSWPGAGARRHPRAGPRGRHRRRLPGGAARRRGWWRSTPPPGCCSPVPGHGHRPSGGTRFRAAVRWRRLRAIVAAFSLNHVDDPAVAGRGGQGLARRASWPRPTRRDDTHPAKDACESAAAAAGRRRRGT